MKEITWKNNVGWFDWQANKMLADIIINGHNSVYRKSLSFEDAFENKGITKYIINTVPNIPPITYSKIKETIENIQYKETNEIPAIKTGKGGYINLICLNLVNGLSRFNHISQEQLSIIELEVRRALEFTLPYGCYDI